MKLEGKTALVTGSTSGIGLAIAKALARQGANIVLNGLGDIDAAQRELLASGARAMRHEADMRDPAQIEDLMKFCASSFGHVDILVNNAGIQHVANVEAFPVQRWDEIIAVNLSSAFHTTRLALPAMRAANWGRIINVASTHGLVASAQKSAYVAAKHGIVGLTKAVALETATTGITCNAICPGATLTPLAQKQIDDRARLDGASVDETRVRMVGEKQPSLDFVTVEQLAELAVFMCSPSADQVRGAAWAMDGGWTAQ